jgi:hypothetical protein
MDTFMIEFESGRKFLVKAPSRIQALTKLVEEDYDLYETEDFTVKQIDICLVPELIN